MRIKSLTDSYSNLLIYNHNFGQYPKSRIKHFKGSGNLHTLSGKRVYSLLNKKVKSFHYSVEKNGSTVTFKGRGYGHHLGLCQWGAKEMTSQGWNHKDVLIFYYPGTQLMRML